MKRTAAAIAALLTVRLAGAATLRLRVAADPSVDGVERTATVFRCPNWSGNEQNFPNFQDCSEIRSERFRGDRVALPNLPRELLFLLVDADEPHRVHIAGRRVDLRAGEARAASVDFEPARIVGNVMYRGEATPSTLEIREFNSFAPPGPAHVQESAGTFEIRRWAGVYLVHVRPHRSDVPEADLAIVVAEGQNAVNTDLEIPGTRVQFRIADASTGQPVAGAALSIFDDWNPVSRISDDEGRIDIAALAAGTVRVTVKADGHSPESRDVEVADSRDPQAFTIALAPDGETKDVQVLLPDCSPASFVDASYRYDVRTGERLVLPCDPGICHINAALDDREPVILAGPLVGARIVPAGMLRARASIALLPYGGPLVVHLLPGKRIQGGDLGVSVSVNGVELGGRFLDEIARDCSTFSSEVDSDPPAPLTIGALPEGPVEIRVYANGLDSHGRRTKELVAGPVRVKLPSPPIDIALP